MFARIPAGSALAVAVSVMVPSAARADFALVSPDLTINRQAATASFSLTFNQVPDFYKIDSDGIQAESFQIEFDGVATPGASFPQDLTAVVRGDEIHVANAIRVRSPNGNGGANSGGWGPIVGTVPFSLTGKTVAFSVPAKELGWTGGAWSADIFSLASGTLTAERQVSSVPAPKAFWGGLAGLAVVAGMSVRRTLARRSAARAYFAG